MNGKELKNVTKDVVSHCLKCQPMNLQVSNYVQLHLKICKMLNDFIAIDCVAVTDYLKEVSNLEAVAKSSQKMEVNLRTNFTHLCHPNLEQNTYFSHLTDHRQMEELSLPQFIRNCIRKLK